VTRTRVTIAVAVATAVGCALPRQAAADRVEPATKVRRGVNVFLRPSGSSTKVGRIERGQSVELIASVKGWRRVRLKDGTTGYVSAAWSRVRVEPPTRDADTLTVTFVDVGQGDAILLQLGDADVLVDAGPSGAWGRGLGKVLEGVRGPLEAMLITHPHDDHYGGAEDVLRNVKVAALYTNGERRGPPRDDHALATWDVFETAVQNAHLQMQSLAVGDELEVMPSLKITVLATGDANGGAFPDVSEGTAINNDSLVLMVEYAGKRLLLTGDIENAADELLVDRFCDDGQAGSCPRLRADVLKIPHHGSASFDERFFAAVRPAWGVVSAEYQSTKHCLPRVAAIEALRKLGTRIVSTSADGNDSIVLTIAATGAISWKVPPRPLFAWTERTDRKCVGPKTYRQRQ